MGVTRYCFHLTETYMSDALSALFVSDHFSDKSKQEVTDISSTIKKTLSEQIDATPWMDLQTKTYAHEKLKMVTFKMGYPDWMSNHDYVDSMYISLDVNLTSSFTNILSANQYMRSQWSRDLTQGHDRTKWLFRTYDTALAVFWAQNEIIAPSGILQHPVYSPTSPHSVTFGSLGSLFGRFLHHIVDEWGKHYDKYGDRLEDDTSWWSNSSLTSYEPITQCVSGVYSNISKTYHVLGGETWPIYVSERYTPRAIAITNGIRLALKGYNKWVSERGIAEKKLPGLHLSNQQMVFLAHAQSMCYNRDPWMSFYKAMYGEPEEDVQVNTAFKQLKEFSDVWGCKVGDQMNAGDRCDYY